MFDIELQIPCTMKINRILLRGWACKLGEVGEVGETVLEFRRRRKGNLDRRECFSCPIAFAEFDDFCERSAMDLIFSGNWKLVTKWTL